MKRLTTFALVGLSLGLTVGCGDKPPAVIEAKAIDQPRAESAELKPPPKPAATDPDARKLLDDMLAAHTGNQPDKLAALRECSFTRKGTLDNQVTAVWKRDLVWPDRYRVRTEMSNTAGGKLVHTFALRESVGWLQPGEDPNPKSKLSADMVLTLRSQFHEDAVTLLFVLADGQTLAAKAADEKWNDKELGVADVWTPAGEHARLGIDKKTKLLTRIVYVGREASSPDPVTKEITFQEYKEFGGVKLGSKMYAQTKSQSLGVWTELTVDLTKPDAKLFDGP
jgi:hypothetical protein